MLFAVILQTNAIPRRLTIAITLVVFSQLVAYPPPSLAVAKERADDDGWITLFDGKTLNGWHTNPEKIGHGTGGIWTVEPGGVLAGRRQTDGAACAFEERHAHDRLGFAGGALHGWLRLTEAARSGTEAAMGEEGGDGTEMRPGEQSIELAGKPGCGWRLFDEIGNAAKADQCGLAFRRDAHVGAGDKRRTERRFKRVDGLGGGGLCDAQCIGRRRQRSLIGKGHEEPDMSKIG